MPGPSLPRLPSRAEADRAEERTKAIRAGGRAIRLAQGADHQFISEEMPPYGVYSHDYGHFFPDGPNWSAASLALRHNAASSTPRLPRV
jgi:hypothetical protein